MEPDPQDPESALCVDVLAPEGYGEVIGGSQRIASYDLLKKRIEEHQLPIDAFQWYLDLRRYGSVPHSGFGMGKSNLLSNHGVQVTLPLRQVTTRCEVLTLATTVPIL